MCASEIAERRALSDCGCRPNTRNGYRERSSDVLVYQDIIGTMEEGNRG